MDEGARYVGEFSLGLNPYIHTPMLDTLFDEKIKGSFHFTPGDSLEESDNGNRSAIHWDIVNIQTTEYGGGEIYFDDILVRKDGLFIFNTFSNRPTEKPIIKEYDIDGNSYIEISYLVNEKVQHIQIREGYDPHFTVFDWISKKEYERILSPYFDIEIIDDGKSSLYVCKKK